MFKYSGNITIQVILSNVKLRPLFTAFSRNYVLERKNYYSILYKWNVIKLTLH